MLDGPILSPHCSVSLPVARSTHFDVIFLVDSLVSVAVFKVESNLDGVIKNRKLVDQEQRKELH